MRPHHPQHVHRIAAACAIGCAVLSAAGASVAQPAPRHHDSPRATRADLAAIRAGIHARSSTEATVTRRARELIMASSPALTASLRVVPRVGDGRVDGLQIFGLSPSHPFTELGLRNGDVLVSILGVPITSPDRALEVYSRLRTATTVPIGITRAGQPMTLTVQVTDR